MIKKPPSMQETWVQSLGQADPLEKGMVTHSSIPAWRVLWTEEPGGLQSRGRKLSDYHLHASHTQTDGQQNHLSQQEEEVTINNVDSQAPFYIKELISMGFGLGNPVISLC